MIRLGIASHHIIHLISVIIGDVSWVVNQVVEVGILQSCHLIPVILLHIDERIVDIPIWLLQLCHTY